MFSFDPLHISNSISAQLMRRVFYWYILIAAILSGFQVYIEYLNLENDLKGTLSLVQKSFEKGLQLAYWNADNDQINLTLRGMLEVPMLSAVVIYDISAEKYMYAYRDGNSLQMKPSKNPPAIFKEQWSGLTPIEHHFDLSHDVDKNNKINVIGNATLYSDPLWIWNRLQGNMIVLLINALLKTIALWGIFISLSRTMLQKPLGKLITGLKHLEWANLESAQTLKLGTRRDNELTLLERAFQQMVEKLLESRHAREVAEGALQITNQALVEANLTLEDRILQRTHSLAIANARLKQLQQITQEVYTCLDLQAASKIFVEGAVKAVLKDGSGSVLLYEAETNMLHFQTQFGLNEVAAKAFSKRVTPQTLYAYDVFANKRMRLISADDLKDIEDIKDLHVLHQGRMFVEQLVVPLVMNERCIGLFNISHYEKDFHFHPEDQQFFENLGLVLSQHFENLRLFEQATRSEQEWRLLNEAVRQVNSSLNLDEVIKGLITLLKPVFEFDQLWIGLVEQNELYFYRFYGHHPTPSVLESIRQMHLLLKEGENAFADSILKNQSFYVPQVNDEFLSQTRGIVKQLFVVNPVKSLLGYPLEVGKEVFGLIVFSRQQENFNLSSEDIEKVQSYVTQIATSIHNAQVYEKLQHTQTELAETQKIASLKSAFERFVPRQFLQRMQVDGLDAIRPGYHQGESLTMLFSDIRGFTELSESMSAEENFNFINSYLYWMEPCIMQHGGFVDKFIGDAIMALFDGEDSARRAIAAAVMMQREVERFNDYRVSNGLTPIRMGIGINTGAVTIGVVGSENRMDSTVIGDHVNLASRIEALTKFYNSRILISHFTHDALSPHSFHIREVDIVKVKGKSVPIKIYEVFDTDEKDVVKKKLETLYALYQGVELFKLRKFMEAIPHFETCLAIFPADIVALEYLKRCFYLNKYPPKQEYWNGVMQDTDYNLHLTLKRRTPRFENLMPINLYVRNRKQHFAGNTLDFAFTGVKIESNCDLIVLDTLLVEVFFKRGTLAEFVDQRPLRVMGQVAWKKRPDERFSKDEWIYGIEFVMLTHDDEKLLRDELMLMVMNPAEAN